MKHCATRMCENLACMQVRVRLLSDDANAKGISLLPGD